MIDVSNLKDALETLGFVAHGDIHEKVFPEIGCSLKVDFHAKKLIYPNEIKGRERNNLRLTVPTMQISSCFQKRISPSSFIGMRTPHQPSMKPGKRPMEGRSMMI